MSLLEIIDSAVKIGLGAAISGVTAWMLAKQAAGFRLNESTIENTRNLIKEFSVYLESVKKYLDMVAHAYYKEDLEIARERIIDATNNLRSAQAIANIIDNKNILESLRKAEQEIMAMYHELREKYPDLNKLKVIEGKIFSKLEFIQPEISKAYRNVKT